MINEETMKELLQSVKIDAEGVELNKNNISVIDLSAPVFKEEDKE